jgi:uncharacterized protein (TIGR03083 family)
MPIDYRSALTAEATRFVDVLRGTDPSAPVPTCPDWRADDLLYHLAEVFDNWTKVLREGRAGDDISPPERPGDRAGLLALYHSATAALLDVIETTPPDQPMWSWVYQDVTASWLPRRMAHEALIHRLDAELTAGTPTGFDAELAADGVGEVLEYFYSWRPGWATVHSDGPVGRLATTDTGGKWLIRLDAWSGDSPDSGKSYDHVPCPTPVASGEPSFEIRATAGDLDTWLWNRPTAQPPQVDGDRAAFEQFSAVVAQGLQ